MNIRTQWVRTSSELKHIFKERSGMYDTYPHDYPEIEVKYHDPKDTDKYPHYTMELNREKNSKGCPSSEKLEFRVSWESAQQPYKIVYYYSASGHSDSLDVTDTEYAIFFWYRLLSIWVQI